MTLVCFDWDGTIADTWPLYRLAAERYCPANDLYLPTEAELRLSFGNAYWDGLSQWRGNKEDHWAHRENLYALLNQLAEEAEAYHLVNSIAETVTFCLEQNMKVGVATSRPRTDLVRAIQKCQWETVFASYITSTCAHEKGLKDKPSPDMLHYMMTLHGETPETTIMIGDTVHDMRMAGAANCNSIAVTWGAGAESDLTALKPSAICRNPAELSGIIQSLAHNPS